MFSVDLGGWISAWLAGDVAASALAEGAHLRTQALADRYRVLSTQVRDALMQLARAGLLVHHPNRGFFAAGPLPRGAAAASSG